MPDTAFSNNFSRGEDLTGRKFGRLTISSVLDSKTVMCRCDCGKETRVGKGHIKSGHTKSCGCLVAEVISTNLVTHGHSTKGKASSTYNSWRGMRQRCLNKNNPCYRHYGARGITVCDRWINSFENFLEDMGVCPNGMTIERINSNANYEPSNCRWDTRRAQSLNTSSNVLLSLNGKTQPMSLWAEEVGINSNCIRSRIDRGWTHEQALTIPVGSIRKLASKSNRA